MKMFSTIYCISQQRELFEQHLSLWIDLPAHIRNAVQFIIIDNCLECPLWVEESLPLDVIVLRIDHETTTANECYRLGIHYASAPWILLAPTNFFLTETFCTHLLNIPRDPYTLYASPDIHYEHNDTSELIKYFSKKAYYARGMPNDSSPELSLHDLHTIPRNQTEIHVESNDLVDQARLPVFSGKAFSINWSRLYPRQTFGGLSSQQPASEHTESRLPGSSTSFHKVFGIGFFGTSAIYLNYLLRLFDIESCYCPHDLTTFAELRLKKDLLSVLAFTRGITGSPAAYYYQTLDRSYPGSKFILTVCDEDIWLDAYKRECRLSSSPLQEFLHSNLIGSSNATDASLREAYRTHNEIARDYFKGREEDFLEISVSTEDAWKELWTFLDKDIPLLKLSEFNIKPALPEEATDNTIKKKDSTSILTKTYGIHQYITKRFDGVPLFEYFRERLRKLIYSNESFPPCPKEYFPPPEQGNASESITLVVPVYSNADSLHLCLLSLTQQDDQNFTVYVVNDGGDYALQGVAAEFKNKLDLHYMYLSPKTAQFRLSETRNLALLRARTSRVICLDSDMFSEVDLVSKHKRYGDSPVTVLGIRKYVSENHVQELANTSDVCAAQLRELVYADDSRYTRPSLHKHESFKNLTSPGKRLFEYAFGCNLSFPTRQLHELGGYNEEMVGWGHEDQEMTLRLCRLGCDTLLDTSIVGYHLDHEIHPVACDNELRSKYTESIYFKTRISHVKQWLKRFWSR